MNKKQISEDVQQNQDLEEDSQSPSLPSRRKFIGNVGGITAATIAATVVGLPSLSGTKSSEVEAAEIGPQKGNQRRNKSAQIRHKAEVFNKQLGPPPHPCNGDEDLYPNKIGSYSKGLPHDNLGEVDLNAYDSLLNALSSGENSDFEAIPLGSPLATRRRLVNPQSGLAFDLEGTDSHQLAIPPAPAFASAEEAGEIVENYWMALLRDAPFTQYDSDSLAQDAAADIQALSDFRGPKSGGQVTTGTLFRGFTPGDLAGPYLSQFMLLPAQFGTEVVDMRQQTVSPGIDYMTAYPDWLSVQNGNTQGPESFDPTLRYIRNGRDLSAFVHIDVLFQAYFNACLTLLSIGAPFNPDNPYSNSQTQEGFGTFGGPHIKSLLSEVATRALKAVWYQKWFVHRRLRPEAFGGRIHNHLIGAANYPIHPDALNSQAIAEVFNNFGTFLLPMAFPEGSPTHPAYGAGHATVAGASVTAIKAFFDGSVRIADLLAANPLKRPDGTDITAPQVPSTDGLSLLDYTGSDAGDLTVEGELNKLAANISIGRNHAGVHWRTDYTESLLLGEAVTISILRDQRATYNEPFGGFTFRKFNGTTITV